MSQPVAEATGPSGGGREPPSLLRLLWAGSGLIVVLAVACFALFGARGPKGAPAPTDSVPVDVRDDVLSRAANRAPVRMVSVFLVCDMERATQLNLAIAGSGAPAAVLHDGDPSRTDGRHVLAEMQARGVIDRVIYDDCLNPSPAPVASLLDHLR